MCVATPVKIKKVEGQTATVADNLKVDLALVCDAKKGDWLLCHGGLAIQKVSKEDAQEILVLAKTCSH